MYDVTSRNFMIFKIRRKWKRASVCLISIPIFILPMDVSEHVQKVLRSSYKHYTCNMYHVTSILSLFSFIMISHILNLKRRRDHVQLSRSILSYYTFITNLLKCLVTYGLKLLIKPHAVYSKSNQSATYSLTE